MLNNSLAEAKNNTNSDLLTVCPQAGDSRTFVEGRAHSSSVSNITEPEVVSEDCVG